MKNENTAWASKEFGEIDLGDQRLTDRLVKIADKLASSPESPINQACGDWANTKAAYRFFQNEKINEKIILQSHIDNTFGCLLSGSVFSANSLDQVEVNLPNNTCIGCRIHK